MERCPLAFPNRRILLPKGFLFLTSPAQVELPRSQAGGKVWEQLKAGGAGPQAQELRDVPQPRLPSPPRPARGAFRGQPRGRADFGRCEQPPSLEGRVPSCQRVSGRSSHGPAGDGDRTACEDQETGGRSPRSGGARCGPREPAPGCWREVAGPRCP
ncbi:hypothetical protein VULLAG_LOCUS6895 [Vulpes lagopus]